MGNHDSYSDQKITGIRSPHPCFHCSPRQLIRCCGIAPGVTFAPSPSPLSPASGERGEGEGVLAVGFCII